MPDSYSLKEKKWIIIKELARVHYMKKTSSMRLKNISRKYDSIGGRELARLIPSMKDENILEEVNSGVNSTAQYRLKDHKEVTPYRG